MNPADADARGRPRRRRRPPEPPPVPFLQALAAAGGQYQRGGSPGGGRRGCLPGVPGGHNWLPSDVRRIRPDWCRSTLSADGGFRDRLRIPPPGGGPAASGPPAAQRATRTPSTSSARTATSTAPATTCGVSVGAEARGDDPAEPAAARQRGQRGGGDDLHGGGPDARHHQREGQRQLDPASSCHRDMPMPRAASTTSRSASRDPDVGVGQQRRHGEEHQRDDHRHVAVLPSGPMREQRPARRRWAPRAPRWRGSRRARRRAADVAEPAAPSGSAIAQATAQGDGGQVQVLAGAVPHAVPPGQCAPVVSQVQLSPITSRSTSGAPSRAARPGRQQPLRRRAAAGRRAPPARRRARRRSSTCALK